MNRQAWLAWLLILLQAVLFWYLSETIVFPILVAAVSLPAVLWRRRRELSPTHLPFVDLALALLCSLKWYFAPHDPQNSIGYVLYSLVHAAGQFFLLVQVARLWARRPDRPLPVYLPMLAVLVFLCVGDVSVSGRQRRMYQHATFALVGLSVMYYSVARRRHAHVVARRHRWLRPTLSAAVLLTTGLSARAGNAWVKDRWTDIDRIFMRAIAPRHRLPKSDVMIGFSGQAHLGSVQLLKSLPHNEIALRVVTSHSLGYLRGRAFDRFFSRGWELHPALPPLSTREPLWPQDGARLPTNETTPPTRSLFPLKPVDQTTTYRAVEVWRATPVDRFVFLPLATAFVEVPIKQLVLDRHSVVSADNFPPDVNYTAWLPQDADPATNRPLVQPDEWMPGSPFELPSERARIVSDELLQLPERVDPRVKKLASDLFVDCESPRDKIDAVRRHFGKDFRYQLGISVPRRSDPLTYFLFEQPAAHCEFFATGTAVLLRLGGVHCRYVTGFTGGEFNALGGYWIVRQSNAHAWVEVYLPDEGWIIVDATPSEGIPSASDSFSVWHMWDEINLRGQMIRAQLANGSLSGILIALKLFALTLVTTVPGWLLTSGILFLFARQIRWRPHLLRPSRIPATLIELHRLLEQLDRCLRRLRLERAAHETLHQFAERLRTEADSRPSLNRAVGWYQRYAATRYGEFPSDKSRNELRDELQSIYDELAKLPRAFGSFP